MYYNSNIKNILEVDNMVTRIQGKRVVLKISNASSWSEKNTVKTKVLEKLHQIDLGSGRYILKSLQTLDIPNKSLTVKKEPGKRIIKIRCH
jgi:hypothetical protein